MAVNEQATIAELMRQTGVRFGTSGARGLQSALSDRLGYAYTKGFLQYALQIGDIAPATAVAIGGDRRKSTPRLMNAARLAAEAIGLEPLNAGQLPSPALALYGLRNKIATVMVTGSHIPEDRNGLKFNKAGGEVLKSDESGILAQAVTIPADLFDAAGQVKAAPAAAWQASNAPSELYLKRYTDFFAPDALAGMRLGWYQHSAVGRELLPEICRRLGAAVTLLAPSEKFVPVDTEAIRPADAQAARDWAAGGQYDALLSSDGDSDRPLLATEKGAWLPGDLLGLLAARWLGLETICLPVSCNSAAEKCGWFRTVCRTKIGSPYVIAAMQAAASAAERVGGFEANGGFLQQTPLNLQGKTLPPLPTRDALLPQLAVLLAAKEQKKSLTELLGTLPACFTASDILRDLPPAALSALSKAVCQSGPEACLDFFNTTFAAALGAAAVRVALTDGARFTLANNAIVHLRPSGNAPEFRCYTEAASPALAAELCALTLKQLKTHIAGEHS